MQANLCVKLEVSGLPFEKIIPDTLIAYSDKLTFHVTDVGIILLLPNGNKQADRDDIIRTLDELKQQIIKKARKPRKAQTDIKDMTFGDLTAIEPTEKRTKRNSIIWRCRCDRCGNEEVEVPREYLVNGNTKSCGCRKRENNLKIYEKLHWMDGVCVEYLEKRGIRRDNTSGHIGVSHYRGKYRANITFKRKRQHLGTFDTVEEAIQARKRKEDELFKPFLDEYYRQLNSV